MSPWLGQRTKRWIASSATREGTVLMATKPQREPSWWAKFAYGALAATLIALFLAVLGRLF